MTCERIVALLNGMGVVISKRQVVRLLTAKLDMFRAEDEAVLEAGLSCAPYITVDDTGARHAGKNGYTTQIGSGEFRRVSHRADQIAPRLSLAALRRGAFLCRQRGGDRIHERTQLVADRRRQARRP